MNTTELIEAVKSAQKVILVDVNGNEVPYTTFRELGHWLYEALTEVNLSTIERSNELIILKHRSRDNAHISHEDDEEWVDTSDLATGPLANWATLSEEQATAMLTKAEPEPRAGTNQFNQLFNQLGLKYEDWYLDHVEDCVAQFCHEEDSSLWIELDFNTGTLKSYKDRDCTSSKTFTINVH